MKAKALAAIGVAVFPVREKPERADGRIFEMKTPYTRSGHLEATTDARQIEQWWSRWPDALVGVNAGRSGLVTADIDMGDGHDGWNTLIENGLDDLPETAHYQTNRGGDHYVYAAPSDVRLSGTKGHVTPDGLKLEDVDRRGGSSYFIWWGNEIPATRDAFGEPPAWLLTPAAEPTESPYSGTVGEWLQRAPEGSPSWSMADVVNSIPRDSDFGHSELISFQASIVALAANGETGAVEALEILKREWLRGEYDTPVYRDDWDAGLAGAIRKFGDFPDKPIDILAQDQVSIATRVTTPGFIDIWTTLPAVTTAPALRDRLGRIMTLAYDSSLTALEAATLAWHSPAAKHANGIRSTQSDGEALDAVWKLALEVAGSPVLEEGAYLADVEPAAPVQAVPDLLPTRSIKLLTDAEAARVVNLSWWGDEFMDVMRKANRDVISEQIYRLNRWVILSLCFSHRAIIPMVDGADIILNFYGVVVGGSKVGKSRATKPVTEISKLFWEEVYNPDIGGDATKAGLTDALIALDGLPTYFHPDEADAILLAWKDIKGPFAGMSQFITDVYLGDVKATLRATKDNSGKHAQARLNAILSGIQHQITDAIDPKDWETGFINRFVWAFGERKQLTREQKRPNIKRKGADASAVDLAAWYQQWVARFNATLRTTLDVEPGEKFAWIDMTDEVADRHVETLETLERIAASGPYEDRLDPTFGRLQETILKCAALVAITNNRRCIQMDDYLLALEQAEEWASNIVTLVEATDESPMARRANRLVRLIEKNGGRMPLTEIHRNPEYAGRSRDVKQILDELTAQGRAELLDLRSQQGQQVVSLIRGGRQ
ncbi:MAG: hypothetical protein BGN98_13850 [Microbacterium sp. 69-7]|nr:MAG: hypothetical protein BGN98_13850 [Microbacterium sp. 69-7]